MSSSTSYIMSVPRRAQPAARQLVSARQLARRYASVPKPPTVGEPLSGDRGAPSKTLPSTPYTVKDAPVFPAPKDPFEQLSPAERSREQPKYSEGTKNFVMGLARLMGYNSAASTAIRETGRMMKGIVDSVEDDRSFWYEECGLAPTYQTFFQIHLLYLLMLLPRLRALPAAGAPTQSPIPEPLEPQQPEATRIPPGGSQTGGGGVLVKPNYESYPLELLNHFFELSESEMRQVLGKGERERTVQRYMAEFGEQWKGAGVGLDYVLGLSTSEIPEEVEKSDVELASWVWRNLFQARGLVGGTELVPPAGAGLNDGKDLELEMPNQLETVVRFVRREMKRLDEIPDIDVLAGNIGIWGKPRDDMV